jgi:hypothetical protein
MKNRRLKTFSDVRKAQAADYNSYCNGELTEIEARTRGYQLSQTSKTIEKEYFLNERQTGSVNRPVRGGVLVVPGMANSTQEWLDGMQRRKMAREAAEKKALEVAAEKKLLSLNKP